MAGYEIFRSDPTVTDLTLNPIIVPDGQIGSIPPLSVDLVGRRFIGYGTINATTQTHLLENFASGTAPDDAIIGQLWFDKTIPPGTLKVATEEDPVVWQQVGGSATNLGTGEVVYADNSPTGAMQFKTLIGVGPNIVLTSDGNEITITGDGATWGSIVGTLSDQTDLQAVLDDKVHWENTYNGSSYLKNDMVRDGAWTMIANVDTSDRPAPQPEGNRVWTLPDDPVWTNSQAVSVKEVLTGTRFTAQTTVYVSGLKIWLPVEGATVSYSAYYINDPSGTPILEPLFTNITAPAVGWKGVDIAARILTTGTQFDIVLTVTAGTGTSFTGDWNYIADNDGDPIAGEALQGIGANKDRLRIHKTDNVAADRSTDLNNIGVGDQIEADGVEWRVDTAQLIGDYYEFTLLSETSATDGLLTFTFTYHAPGSLDYVEILNQYSGNPGLKGFISTTGYANIGAVNDDAYAPAIQVQEISVSPDWDVVATSQLVSGQVGTIWGTINGTLSDQVDLQDALDTKIETYSKLGAGETLLGTRTGVDLAFKSLIGGTNVTLTSDGDAITIESVNTGEVNTASNLGAGAPVFSSKSGVDLQFKSFVQGTNVTIAQDSSTITISSVNTGEVNTASNLGGGSGVYASKFGSDLRFQSLVGGTNVSLTSNGSEITISSADTGEINTASNLGGGSGLYESKLGQDLRFKSLIGGTNVTLVEGVNTITIDSVNTGLENIVEDTTPELGGNLGLSGFHLLEDTVRAPSSYYLHEWNSIASQTMTAKAQTYGSIDSSIMAHSISVNNGSNETQSMTLNSPQANASGTKVGEGSVSFSVNKFSIGGVLSEIKFGSNKFLYSSPGGGSWLQVWDSAGDASWVSLSNYVPYDINPVHIGTDSGTGVNTVAIGKSAGQTGLGGASVAIGINAGQSGLGSSSVAIGTQAGNNNTGNNIVVIGHFAGENSGDNVVAVGTQAGRTNQGTDAVAVGASAGAITQGSSAVAVGRLAGNDTQGIKTVAVGTQAGSSDQGDYSVAIGDSAGSTNQGQDAIAIGGNASQNNQGTLSIAIGVNSGQHSFTNSTSLGANSTVTGNDQLQLGDSAVTSYAYGIVQNRSDIRDKADIEDTVLGLEFINNLHPVQGRWDMRDDYRSASLKEDKDASRHIGDYTQDGTHKRTRKHQWFIAQEVEEVCKDMGVDFAGLQHHKKAGGEDVYSLGYSEFIPPVVKAIQTLSEENESLRVMVANLVEQLKQLSK